MAPGRGWSKEVAVQTSSYGLPVQSSKTRRVLHDSRERSEQRGSCLDQWLWTPCIVQLTWRVLHVSRERLEQRGSCLIVYTSGNGLPVYSSLADLEGTPWLQGEVGAKGQLSRLVVMDSLSSAKRILKNMLYFTPCQYILDKWESQMLVY